MYMPCYAEGPPAASAAGMMWTGRRLGKGHAMAAAGARRCGCDMPCMLEGFAASIKSHVLPRCAHNCDGWRRYIRAVCYRRCGRELRIFLRLHRDGAFDRFSTAVEEDLYTPRRQESFTSFPLAGVALPHMMLECVRVC